MNYKHSLILLFGIGSSIAYDTQYIQGLKQEVLSGQVFSELQPESVIVEIDVIANIKKLFKSHKSNFKPLPKIDALKKAWFELPSQTPNCKQIIDRMTIQELSLFPRDRDENNNLIDNITDTESNGFSAIGQKRCAEMLSMPQISHKQLSARRDIIKILSKDSTLLNEIKSFLKILKESEPYVLDFYGKDGISQHEEAMYPGIVLKALSLSEFPSALTASNRLWMFGLSPAMTPTLMGVGMFGVAVFGHYSDNNPITKELLYQLAQGSASMIYAIYTNKQMLCIQGILSPLYVANLGLARSVLSAIKNMQERAIGFATYVRTAKKLMTLLNDNPDLAELMPSLKDPLNKLEGNNNTLPNKYTYLNELLQNASTFDVGEPSALSSPGNTLVAYKYLCDKDTRAEYASVMNMVGEIDVYANLADKIRKHNGNTDASYCFVEFIEKSNKPILDVQDFWHPLINTESVVSNSISLNTNDERNMIITGPNTGGKSTTMKAIATSVLFAQTFGIAPASSMHMTLFSAICTYLNVSDDIGSDLSLFKAEVKRFQDLMKTIKNLSDGSFAFVILDEIFTGTSPDKAEKLSYEGFKKLSDLNHIIFLAATHFKKNTELENVTDNATKNYQMEAVTDSNDNVVEYTYKLIPGISKISSAQQIVDEAYLEI